MLASHFVGNLIVQLLSLLVVKLVRFVALFVIFYVGLLSFFGDLINS